MADTKEAPKFEIISEGTHESMGIKSGDLVPEGQKEVEENDDEQDSETPKPSAEPASTEEKAKEESSEKKPEPEKKEEQSAEPAKDQPSKVLGSSLAKETPEKKTEDKKEDQKPASTTPKSWEDTLKEQGFDDEFLVVAKHYKSKGNLNDYVKASSTDFKKMSPNDVFKFDLQQQYPDATTEDLQALFDAEVTDKYKLDAELYDPESREVKGLAVKYKMDANKLAEKYSTEYAKLKLPSNDPVAQAQAKQAENEALVKTSIDNLRKSEPIKSLVSSKKVAFKDLGEGIPDYHVELADPEEIFNIMVNDDVRNKYMQDKDGKNDINLFIQDATFQHNRQGFIKHLINYGRMLGNEEAVERKENPSTKSKGQQASVATETLAQAFAKRGVHGKVEIGG